MKQWEEFDFYSSVPNCVPPAERAGDVQMAGERCEERNRALKEKAGRWGAVGAEECTGMFREEESMVGKGRPQQSASSARSMVQDWDVIPEAPRPLL